MITVQCLACKEVTDHDAELHDMVDVICPHCRCRTRIVATPMNIEMDEDDKCTRQS
jgi:hypothetical protein